MVVFDLARTSLERLRTWVRHCGYDCAGQSVPAHGCDPLLAPAARAGAAAAPSVAAAEKGAPPEEVMGHGGHTEMSMAAMMRDMRNRFL